MRATVGSSRVPGSAESLLAGGVSLLAPEETVFTSMLDGWEVQQRSRMLVASTIKQRAFAVRRFHRFTGEYPWAWTPSDVDRAPCGGGLSRWSSVSRRPAREGGHDSIIPVGVQLRHGCFG